MNKFINDDNFNNLSIDYVFPTVISRYKAPEFLDDVRPEFYNYIKQSESLHGVDDIYPCTRTEDMIGNVQTSNLEKFIADLSWEVIKRQGYGVDNVYTQVQSMFGQSHKRTSSMEVHSHGSFLSGLYFIDTPLDSCNIIFHDPRTVNHALDLIEVDYNRITPASKTINFKAEPGDIIITNAWLPHSISRNRNILPFNFIHFTINLVDALSVNTSTVPIVI